MYNMYIYIYIYIYTYIINIKSQSITKLDFKDVLSFHDKGYTYTYRIHIKKLLLTTSDNIKSFYSHFGKHPQLIAYITQLKIQI